MNEQIKEFISDESLREMVYQLRQQLYLTCRYMQIFTPFGDEYLEAFDAYERINKDIDFYEKKLIRAFKLYKQEEDSK